MRIDAHQHVWDLKRSKYGWLGPHLAPIHRTIEFTEARDRLRAAGIDATILVQSDDTDADTDFMLEVQERFAEVVGVVGYVPLHDPERAAERIAQLQRHSAFVGIRTLIHDLPDPDYLLRDDVDAGLGVLEHAGVPFDLVAVLPRHLEVLLEVSERHPELSIVIDHLAKPPIGGASDEPWRSLIAAAAQNPRVHAKVSGLYSASGDPASWSVSALRPFWEHALEHFGADRLMYGGDWPVSMIAGDYERVWVGLRVLIDELAPEQQERVLAGTASEFYSLHPELLARAAAARE